MRERLGGAIAPTLAFTAVLVLWQGSVWLLRPPPFILPGIGQVIARLVAFGPNWAGHVVATIEGIALGFLAAVVVSTAVGLTQIEPDLLDLARSIKARPAWVFFRIRFPSSLPYFFAGLRVASTLAVIGAVIGEFVGSDVGLGYLIVIANNQIDTALGLAAIFLISLIGLLLYGAVVLTERLCTPWAGGEGGLETSL